MPRTQVQTATIANGATVSDAIRIDPGMITGLVMPAAFTGTAIAVHASTSYGGTYNPVYDSDGNAVSAAVAASRNVGFSGAEADAIAAFAFIKLVSNGAEGAARSIGVVTRV